MIPESFFVSGKIHKRAVKLPNGEKHDMFFKELSQPEFMRFYITENSLDENVRITSFAKLISSCLCNEDGSVAMTFEQACQLNTTASTAISEQILILNGQGVQKKG